MRALWFKIAQARLAEYWLDDIATYGMLRMHCSTAAACSLSTQSPTTSTSTAILAYTESISPHIAPFDIGCHVWFHELLERPRVSFATYLPVLVVLLEG